MSFGTWTGRWWLPDSPARVVQGTLTFSDEELTLVLAEPLAEITLEADQVFETLSEPTIHPLVHGIVDGGQPTTLVNVNGNAFLIPFASGTETWFPHWGFIGLHLVDPDQAIFGGAMVTMEDLAVWLGGRPPVVSGQRSKADLLNVSVSAERKVLYEAATRWGSVSAVAQPAVDAAGLTVTVSMLHWLHTTTTEPVPWTTIWMEHVLPLQELLVIALGRPCPIESLQLTVDDTEVTALFRTVDHGRPRRPRSVASHNFLVTAAELPDGFEAAVNRWYDLELAHQVAVRSLTDTLRSAERFLPDRITGLVRAISPLVNEQQKVAAAETADLDYQLWLDKVELQIADANIRAAVLAKLKNKPNATDTQRLKVIATDLGIVGAWLTGGDIDGFAKRVVASRVAASHPSSKAPKNAVSGAELLRHTLALSWMLRCAVLARLGVPLDDLRHRAEDGGAQPALDPAR